MNDNKITQQTQ